ncbi:hypothetical protein H5410_039739 [Solanum commersonii]|uniref:S-protein homolog n=1 Tax=Solanum commersonii TaxID=4109 RepID=A0A9J5XLU8_SOLCO|nr:hypothetical protein H5410_039739 [Solanum commersonii]
MANASVFNPTINEIFINNISRSTPPLDVHCLSRDDDLGVHTLEPGDKYDFSFHENFLSTTHFYCKLKWGRNSSIFDDYAIYLALVKNPSPSDFKFAYTW